MANYNKYINTFESSGDTTDVSLYDAYLLSTDVDFPNVAYLKTSDAIRYKKTGMKYGPIGSIYYSDFSFTGPDDDVDTTKTPIGICVGLVSDDPIGDKKITIMAYHGFDANGNPSASNSNTTPYLDPSTCAVDVPTNPHYSYAGAAALSGSTGYVEFYNAIDYLEKNVSTLSTCYYTFIRNYHTSGTTAGEWFMPNYYEARLCHINKTVINSSLSKLKTAFPSLPVVTSVPNIKTTSQPTDGSNFYYLAIDFGIGYERPKTETVAYYGWCVPFLRK